jgi:hypothetical protein
MTELLLGLIALATLTTAILELVVIVRLVGLVKRQMDRVERIARQIAPLAGHASAISEDLSRARALADSQLDRVVSAYMAVEEPVRHGVTALAIARNLTGVFRRNPRRRARRASSKSAR